MPHLQRAAATIQMVPGNDSSNTPKKSGVAATVSRTRQRLQQPFQNLNSRLRQRRSRSAPPKLKTPLLEHHFRVDPKQKVVLPGVPKHEDDWNRDSHDFFNLIVLIPIIALNVMNWNWDRILDFSKSYTFSEYWTGEWFDAFFISTVLYFVVDLLWILILPSCVKSPSTIIQHHIATLLYIMVPYITPEVRWCMGACMSVEINTWFLIARRVFNKSGFPPWVIDLSFVSIRVKIISVCFFVTWVGIRCILYPAMMGFILNRWLTASARAGTYINFDLISPILHTTFCALNFKWSYDLLMSKIRYYKRSAMYQSKGMAVPEDKASKGL
eukprot:Nitzschia sp. Nitz4//scaffold213_size37731//21181//22161//NITZ4_007722-RA/size37731-processed-gene-0.42-mRNA-1//1//CDS//3329542071//786//frame0